MNDAWKMIIAVVITALVVAPLTYVLKPTPVSPEVASLQAQLDEANAEIADLQNQLAAIPPRPGEDLTLYFVSNGRSTCDWWAEAKHGWDNVSEVLGVPTHIMLFGEEDPSSEGNAMQSAIAAHPDGICVSNAFPTVLNPMIEQAIAEGIPVVQGVVYDESISIEAPGVYFAFGDDYRGLVKYLAPMIKAKFPSQTINVLCGAMAPDAVYSILRIQGFEDGLKAANISYNLDVLPLGGEPAQIVSLLKTYLLGHTVHVYFGTDCDATDWIGPALKELGYNPGDIIASGADVLPHTADAIREGYVQASVHMGQWAMIQYATIQLVLLVKYHYPARNIGIPGIIVTTDNVDFFENPW